jgi:hypothetical protein
MEQLIKQLESAPGSSFELNSAIARLDFYRETHGDLADDEVPDFCASIDTALTLLPEGHDWSLFADNGSAMAGCQPASDDGCDMADVPGATPALAIVAACLKARLLDAASSEARG